uniref:Macro domain-containing protein n=1 Tax=Odontella aurita TaxID=265563 RepID=A0A7S4MVN3_9STRA|mmetsp:Transcript_35398/g.105738  ORF Transcript_35398/g.105738 Transcript_35398/m.105738 type:complete len:247 (+) Transcript_35398:243-983(+)
MDSIAQPEETRLERLGSYTINASMGAKDRTNFDLIFSGGSVIDFVYPNNPTKATIVNAANGECLGGGGADGAISSAGGPNLLNDRLALPIIKSIQSSSTSEDDISEDEIYCEINVRWRPTGNAKLSGPGEYGSLKVSNVIHAVGPNYLNCNTMPEEADALLRSAYAKSLELAEESDLEAVAFCLLSAGMFRGDRTLDHVLRIAVEAVCDFKGYDSLCDVHTWPFSLKKADALAKIAQEIGLEKANS